METIRGYGMCICFKFLSEIASRLVNEEGFPRNAQPDHRKEKEKFKRFQLESFLRTKPWLKFFEQINGTPTYFVTKS